MPVQCIAYARHWEDKEPGPTLHVVMLPSFVASIILLGAAIAQSPAVTSCSLTTTVLATPAPSCGCTNTIDVGLPLSSAQSRLGSLVSRLSSTVSSASAAGVTPGAADMNSLMSEISQHNPLLGDNDCFTGDQIAQVFDFDENILPLVDDVFSFESTLRDWYGSLVDWWHEDWYDLVSALTSYTTGYLYRANGCYSCSQVASLNAALEEFRQRHEGDHAHLLKVDSFCSDIHTADVVAGACSHSCPASTILSSTSGTPCSCAMPDSVRQAIMPAFSSYNVLYSSFVDAALATPLASSLADFEAMKDEMEERYSVVNNVFQPIDNYGCLDSETSEQFYQEYLVYLATTQRLLGQIDQFTLAVGGLYQVQGPESWWASSLAYLDSAAAQVCQDCGQILSVNAAIGTVNSQLSNWEATASLQLAYNSALPTLVTTLAQPCAVTSMPCSFASSSALASSTSQATPVPTASQSLSTFSGASSVSSLSQASGPASSSSFDSSTISPGSMAVYSGSSSAFDLSSNSPVFSSVSLISSSPVLPPTSTDVYVSSAAGSSLDSILSSSGGLTSASPTALASGSSERWPTSTGASSNTAELTLAPSARISATSSFLASGYLNSSIPELSTHEPSAGTASSTTTVTETCDDECRSATLSSGSTSPPQTASASTDAYTQGPTQTLTSISVVTVPCDSCPGGSTVLTTAVVVPCESTSGAAVATSSTTAPDTTSPVLSATSVTESYAASPSDSSTHTITAGETSNSAFLGVSSAPLPGASLTATTHGAANADTVTSGLSQSLSHVTASGTNAAQYTGYSSTPLCPVTAASGSGTMPISEQTTVLVANSGRRNTWGLSSLMLIPMLFGL